MDRIIALAKDDVERRIMQAVGVERQKYMTRTINELHSMGLTNDFIADTVNAIFDYDFTPLAVKMRLKERKKERADDNNHR